jgi:hypothetical protein
MFCPASTGGRDETAMIAEPKLTPEHRKLLALTGNWSGEEQLSPSPWQEGGSAMAYIGASSDLGGFYIMQEYRQVRDSGISFKARGMFGYDTADRLYKLYWFDSLGYQPPAPASGLWTGDTLSLTRPSMRGVARHVYTFEGADAFHLAIDYSSDRGENWQHVLSGQYRRRASPFTEQDL